MAVLKIIVDRGTGLGVDRHDADLDLLVRALAALGLLDDAEHGPAGERVGGAELVDKGGERVELGQRALERAGSVRADLLERGCLGLLDDTDLLRSA